LKHKKNRFISFSCSREYSHLKILKLAKKTSFFVQIRPFFVFFASKVSTSVHVTLEMTTFYTKDNSGEKKKCKVYEKTEIFFLN
jgi:hypothetical protein